MAHELKMVFTFLNCWQQKIRLSGKRVGMDWMWVQTKNYQLDRVRHSGTILWKPFLSYPLKRRKKKRKIRRIFHDMWKLHEIQISVSTNKVLLEPHHEKQAAFTQWFQRLIVATESICPQKLNIFIIWSFPEKFCKPILKEWNMCEF